MKHLLIPVLALLALTACGGDSHEKVAADTIDVMQEFTTVLEGIDDKASAEAAKPALKKVGEKMNAMSERMEALGEPTTEQQQEMEKMKGMEEAQKKFMAEVMRIGMDPELSPILEDAMKDITPPGGR